jgi:hypothetical protein
MQRSAIKRQKEIARQQRQKEKAAAREERNKEKEKGPGEGDSTLDPDIAGIVPGPQPPQE